MSVHMHMQRTNTSVAINNAEEPHLCQEKDSASANDGAPAIPGSIRSAHPKLRKHLLSKGLEDYFQERVAENVIPYNEVYRDTYYAPSTECKLARQEIACYDKTLVDARESWAARKAVLDKRWEEVSAKNARLKERIPLFSPFYKETFIKRDRNYKTAERERKNIQEEERELRRLHKEAAKLQEMKELVLERQDKFYMFKQYLERTKESSRGEYKDVRELVDRYNVLADARASLSDKTEAFRDTVALKHRELEKDVVMKTNEILTYRNYLYELMDYETLLTEQVFRLDESLLRIKTTAAERTLVIGQIKMSISNLYLAICKSLHRSSKLTHEDTIGQLADIRLSIQEMIRLTKDIKRMLKAAHLTAQAEKLAKEKLIRIQEEKRKRLEKMGKKTLHDAKSLFQIPLMLSSGVPKTTQTSKLFALN